MLCATCKRAVVAAGICAALGRQDCRDGLVQSEKPFAVVDTDQGRIAHQLPLPDSAVCDPSQFNFNQLFEVVKTTSYGNWSR